MPASGGDPFAPVVNRALEVIEDGLLVLAEGVEDFKDEVVHFGAGFFYRLKDFFGMDDSNLVALVGEGPVVASQPVGLLEVNDRRDVGEFFEPEIGVEVIFRMGVALAARVADVYCEIDRDGRVFVDPVEDVGGFGDCVGSFAGGVHLFP